MVESLVLFEIVVDSRWFLRQDSRLQEPAAEGKLSTNLSLSIQNPHLILSRFSGSV